MTASGAEAALIGERDQVYITLGDHAQADTRCPIGYAWMETSDPDTRVVHRLGNSQGREFSELQEGRKKESWDKRFKEEYTFFQLGQMVELKKQGKTLDLHRVNKELQSET